MTPQMNDLPDFQRQLLRWYDRCRRDLPWRVPRGRLPDPYHVLVSELMLQQTQVTTVIPYFHRFIHRFPTPRALADAPEQEVLRLWQGLGYYARARNLQRTARILVHDLDGDFPRSLEQLQELPGIGRYTAGAIRSLAFDLPSPILDGNVMRVLCRLDGIQPDPRTPAIQRRLWQRAEQMVPGRRAGDFNSALMELGATVCTPRQPTCPSCPVRSFCTARARDLQELIPPPRRAKPTPLQRRSIFCIHHEGRYLIEQRPPRGRWAGLWQFVTRAEDGPTDLPVPVEPTVELGRIRHALTHRRYLFTIFLTRAINGDAAHGPSAPPLAWVGLDQLDRYPLPRPHLRVAALLGERENTLPAP